MTRAMQDRGACAVDEALLSLIFQGALELRPWQGFLREMRRRLGCFHANIAFHRKSTLPGHFEAVVDTEGDVNSLTARYLGKYALLDPIPYHGLESGRVYTKAELLGASDAYSREFLHPAGLDELAMLFVEEPDGMRAWITFARSAPAVAFSEAECERIRATAPHLSLALRYFSNLKAAEIERDLYRDAVGSFSIGVLMFDQGGKLMRIDAVGADILARNPAMYLHDERLRLRERRADTELQAAITRALGESRGNGERRSHALRLPGHEHLSLLVRGIAPTASSSSERSCGAVVYLSDTRSAVAPVSRQLMALFQLTTSEAALAAQLARGRSLSAAARALNLSEQTARTYSKHIFSKTGTHRQAELVRLILTSVAQLAG